MIQDALMRVDASLRQFEELKRESIAELAALEKAMAKDRDRHQKEVSRITEKLNEKIMKISNRNITALGAIIVIMSSLSAVIHHII